MAERQVELTKKRVKFEFNQRKKVEEGLKLCGVFEDVARREGFKCWTEYRAFLAGLPE